MKAKLKVIVHKVTKDNYTLRVYGNGINEVYNNLTIDGLLFISGMLIASYSLSL